MKHSELGIEIIEGLNEIVLIEKGRKAAGLSNDSISILPVNEFKPDVIKMMRHKFEMTLPVFAELLGVSTRTLESWESGFRKPSGTHARLLQVITHDPGILKYFLGKNDVMIK